MLDRSPKSDGRRRSTRVMRMQVKEVGQEEPVPSATSVIRFAAVAVNSMRREHTMILPHGVVEQGKHPEHQVGCEVHGHRDQVCLAFTADINTALCCIPSSVTPEGDVVHEFVKVLFDKSSTLTDIGVLEIHSTPGFSLKVVIEVAVDDKGLMLGTKCSLASLTSNDTRTLPHREIQAIRTTSPDDSGSFDVMLSGVASSLDEVILESLNTLLWDKLSQLIYASRFLLYSDGMSYQVTSTSSNKYLIILSTCIDNFTQTLTKAIETIPFFNSLPLEDQLILLKEGMVGLIYLVTSFAYDQGEQGFRYNTLGNQFSFIKRLEQIRVRKEMHQVHQAYTKIFE